MDRGALGARVSRPHFDRPLRALIDGDNLVMRTLDRLWRYTLDMLAFANELHRRAAGRRVLNLGGGAVGHTRGSQNAAAERSNPHFRPAFFSGG
ncbi:recombinase family protein [Arthrobacter sp. PM3]|uniref:recombinase family protein n=1 Tax=Arthrobacter sp. PM3 TaxID=2017685 RepID=UPI0028FCB660|nr:recombinase family protein [Arthrobacter sp. PM3]